MLLYINATNQISILNCMVLFDRNTISRNTDATMLARPFEENYDGVQKKYEVSSVYNPELKCVPKEKQFPPPPITTSFCPATRWHVCFESNTSSSQDT